MTKRWKQGCESKCDAFKGEDEESDFSWELKKIKKQKKKLG